MLCLWFLVLLVPPLQKKSPIHYKLQNHRFFLNNFCNTQCEDPLSCHGAPMCQILGHLDNVCLDLVMIHHILPYLQRTFYPDVWIIYCNSSFLMWMGSRCETREMCQGFIFFWFFLNFYSSGQTLVNSDLPYSLEIAKSSLIPQQLLEQYIT